MAKNIFYFIVLLLFISCSREFKHPLSPGRMIKEFTLEKGQYGSATIVSSNDEYKVLVQLSPTANMTSLIPHIEISDGATISPHSGQAIDVSVNKTVNYTVTAASGEQRQWKVIFSTYDSSISDYDTYSIANILNGQVVQVDGDYKFNEKYWPGTNINIASPEIAQGQNLQRWQEWDIIFHSIQNNTKYYRIRNLNSGLFLQDKSDAENGKQLQQQRAAEDDAQLWRIEQQSELENYTISNKKTNLFITMNNQVNRLILTLETRDDSNDRQKWAIAKLPRDSYRDDEVGQFFSRTTGSVAFDQGNSILLSDGRVLWVTQDAWYQGSLAPNGNLYGNHFISYTNSIIIQPTIHNWSPAAPMMTADGRANGGVGNLIPKYPGKTWSWPGAGVEINKVVYIHNVEGDGLGTDDDHQSLFKLTPVTSTHWKTERTTPQGLKDSEKIMRYANGMVKGNDGYVYVYGSRQIPDSFGFNTYLHVARFPQNNPQDWTFWNGREWDLIASTEPTAHVNTGRGTNYVSFLNGKYIHLTMDQGFYCGITSINMYISTSTTPLGPFTEKKLVHSFTEYYKGENARVYTPLIHVHSTNAKDELLVTYSINFGACVDSGDGAIPEADGNYDPYYYRVKGVRIPYEKIGL